MKLTIEKLDYEGKGVSHKDGIVYFIPRTLPNEIVKFSPLKEAKHFVIGKEEEIIEPSKKRKESFCPFANKCGGCTYDFVSYDDSLTFKKNIVEEIFSRNGVNLPVFTIEKSNPQLEYRNKVSLKVKNKEFGYYEPESHQFVEITKCYLVMSSINFLLQDFAYLGIINGNVTIRSNYNDELLISITSEESPKIDQFLIDKHKIAGIIWNELPIYNNPYFIEKQGNLLYKVHYEAFFQVNTYIAEKISEDILPLFNKDDRVFDLYCGVGYFSLKLSEKVSQVIGIEINKKAVLDAQYNASLNQITNASFHLGKVEEVMKKIPDQVNKVLVDPPRSGINEEVIKSLNEKDLACICYISCNPRTLVRDISLLKESYEITFFKLYDMFPYTKHVECVCVLKHR